MTQRERVLAILVGTLVLGGIGQWGFSKYKTAIESRKNKYESLQEEQMKLSERRMQGALADRQMGEYLVRSISSDTELARTDYKGWLFEVIKNNNIKDASVSGDRDQPVRDIDNKTELYRQMTFVLDGTAGVPEIIGLVHEIQSMDYLHRIKDLDLKREKSSDDFSIKMTIDVLSLSAAPVETERPESQSWRVDPDLVAYTDPILNRNMYEPPNKAPRYDGQGTLNATIGRREAFSLIFKDPEGHGMSYRLVNAPDNVTLDERSGTLRVESDEVTEFDVVVEAIDDGYPRQKHEQKVAIKFSDPPPPPPKEEPKVELAFDDAKQTYLTGLVQGGDDWTAWMDVRTRGKTMYLKVGTEFEIGSIRGVVKEINAEHVKILVGEREITLTSGGTLKSAADAAE